MCRLEAVQEEVHQGQPARARHQVLAEIGAGLDALEVLAVERPLASEQPLVGAHQKAAGAAGRVADGEVRARRGGRASSRGRWTGSARAGVKYWPAPFLPSLAAFSSRPSKAAPFTSTSMAVHSSSSIRVMSRLRLTGLLKRGMDWREDVAEQPFGLPQLAQDVRVVVGQGRAGLVLEAVPVAALRDARRRARRPFSGRAGR